MYQEHTNDREIVVMRSARSIWTSRSACLSVIVAIACQFVADTGGSPARAGESGNDAASAKPATHAETVLIPAPGMGTFGGTVDMHADLFKPDGPGPYPVLIFSHGRAPDRLARAGLKHPIQEWHVRYWLEHGVAVLAPVRVGYGETGAGSREQRRNLRRFGPLYKQARLRKRGHGAERCHPDHHQLGSEPTLGRRQPHSPGGPLDGRVRQRGSCSQPA